MTKKQNLLTVLLLLFTLWARAESREEKVVIDDFTYYVIEEESDVYAVLELASSNLPEDLVVPDSIHYNGNSYRVLGIIDRIDYSGSIDRDNYERVYTIHISKHVEYIGSYYISYYMKNLQSIYVDPENQTYRSEDGMLIARGEEVLEICPAGKSGVLTIPEGIKKIESDFNCPSITSIILPISLNNFKGNLSNANNLESIIVTEGNTYYKSVNNGYLIENSTNCLIAYPRAWTGKLEIPEGVEIISTSFYSKITDIFIPQSVREIVSFGSSAYDLANIQVAESNPYLKSVEGALYSKDGKKLYVFPLVGKTLVEIGDGIETIEDYAFVGRNSSCIVCFTATTPPIISGDLGIEDLYIPSDKIEIYKSAPNWPSYQFYSSTYTRNLKSYDLMLGNLIYCKTETGNAEVIGFYGTATDLNIPSSVNIGGADINVSKIRNRALQSSSFQNVILPEGLIEIGDSAFYYSYKMYTLSLPSTITKIGDYAFYLCWNLKTIHINGMKPIGINNNCFYNYDAELILEGEYADQFKTADVWKDFINQTKVGLIIDGFAYEIIDENKVELQKCITIQESMTIPDEITIGEKTYQITSIGRLAFSAGNNYYSGTQLKQIKLPQYLESIGDSAFYRTELTEITIPSGVKYIGKGAFYGFQLKNITLDNTTLLSYIGENAFYNYINAIIAFPASLKETNPYLTMLNEYKKVIWADFIDGKYAYRNVTNGVEILKCFETEEEMTIPDMINAEGQNYYITSIGALAFSTYDGYYSSTQIKSITLPQHLENVGDSAFYQTRLTELDIPSSVKTIGKHAFYNYYLEKITLHNNSILENVAEKGFYESSIIFAPNSLQSTNNYIASLGSRWEIVWSDYNDGKYYYTVLGENKLEISKCMLFEEEMILPNELVFDGTTYQVTSIGKLAFSSKSDYYSSNYSTTKLTLPDKLESIGDSAFYYIKKLSEIIIPATVKSIGNYALYSNDLRNIKMMGKVPPSAFPKSVNTNYVKILVSPDAEEAYKNAAPWNQFTIISYDAMIDNVSYVITSETEVQVTGIISSNDEIREIPSTIEIEEKIYTVTSTSKSAFNNAYGRLIILPTTINKIDSLYFGSYVKAYIKSQQVPSISHVSKYGLSSYLLFPRSMENDYKSNDTWKRYAEDGNTLYVDGRTDDLIYRIDNNEIAICAWLKRIDNTDEYSIDVPTEVNGLAVTSIAQRAFMNLSVNTIHLPSSIKNIAAYNLYVNSNGYIICDAIEAPTIGYHYSYMRRVYVKPAAYDNYMNAINNGSEWGKFDIKAVDGLDDNFLYTINSDKSGVILMGFRKSQEDYDREITIPNAVTIDNHAFKVVEIGYRAFYNCWRQHYINLPNSLKKIGEAAFESSGIYNITLPASLEEIEADAFMDCSNLSNIIIETGNNYFTTDGKSLMTKDLKRLLVYYGNSSEPYEIPDGVETVDNHAFYNQNEMEELIFPASLISIPITAIYNTKIGKISVNNNNSYYKSADGILYNADMTKIIYYPYKEYIDFYALPGTVTTIGEYALGFANVGKLTLPKALKTICSNAFVSFIYIAGQISEIVITCDEAPEVDYDSFSYNQLQNTILNVPLGQIDYYKTHYPWMSFSNIVSSGIAESDYILLKQFYTAMNNGAGWVNKWDIGDTYSEAITLYGVILDNEHVVSIDLSNNGLTGLLSDALLSLPYLKDLKLNNNQLEGKLEELFSSETPYISPITTLNISHNLISGNLGTLGEKLPQLTTLDASFNKISDVYPMLPTSITSLTYNNQNIDKVYKFSNMLNVYPTDHMSEMPTIIYYRHEQQNYDVQEFKLNNIDTSSENWEINVRYNASYLFASVPYDADKLYKLPSGTIFKLSTTGNDYEHTALVEMDYEMGDVNFDAKVDVSDLQTSILFALRDEAFSLFNFAAADIQSDNWVNVQDIVSLINILMDRDININSGHAGTRSDEASIPAKAHLFCNNNYLILNTETDVAAMEIVVKASSDFKWLLDDSKFSYRMKEKDGFLRILVYSLDGKCIKAGETTLASASSNGIEIISAEIVDINAHHIPIAFASTSTNISNMPNSASLDLKAGVNGVQFITDRSIEKLSWWIYTINGQMIGYGNISDLSAGNYLLECPLNGTQQILVRLSADGVNTVKKISITK